MLSTHVSENDQLGCKITRRYPAGHTSVDYAKVLVKRVTPTGIIVVVPILGNLNFQEWTFHPDGTGRGAAKDLELLHIGATYSGHAKIATDHFDALEIIGYLHDYDWGIVPIQTLRKVKHALES